jgi:hypothetical protein
MEYDLARLSLVLGVGRGVEGVSGKDKLGPLGVSDCRLQDLSGGQTQLHMEGERPGSGFDVGRTGHLLTHRQGRGQSALRGLVATKEDGHCVAGELANDAAPGADLLNQGGKVAVEHPSEFFASLRADLSQSFGQGSKARHVGEQDGGVETFALADEG